MFRVGTSGWSYDHWKKLFYPEKLPAQERLGFYSHHFDTVEVNASFYHLPTETTFRNWKETVPRDFTFAVKASRYLTHLKRLMEPEEPLKLFLSRARRLGTKLGPVLFQLPPNWKVNPERLAALLKLLPRTRRFAFEFRDPSWFTEEVESLLRKRSAAFCIYHMVELDCPLWVTAPFVYLRFHGSSKKYGGSYSHRELERWSKRIRDWLEEGLEVYAYFNNDAYGHAVANGLELSKRIAQQEA
jgi:uncharacterized protein YecE (DUF72 family)